MSWRLIESMDGPLIFFDELPSCGEKDLEPNLFFFSINQEWIWKDYVDEKESRNLSKVVNKSTNFICLILTWFFSKLTMGTSERHQLHCSYVFIVNLSTFIQPIDSVFLFITLNKYSPAWGVILLRGINPFLANVLFLYPLKTLENLRFSDVFRGHRNVASSWNGFGLFFVILRLGN